MLQFGKKKNPEGRSVTPCVNERVHYTYVYTECEFVCSKGFRFTGPSSQTLHVSSTHNSAASALNIWLVCVLDFCVAA